MLRKEEIKKLIEEAFNDVALDGGTSLKQTKVIDNYGRGVTEKEFAALPNNEVTDDWKQIPTSLLDEADCLSHLDEKGFRYYIPALLLRLLENYDSGSMMTIGTLHYLYPKMEGWEHLYSQLNEKQQQAIAIYLEALPDLVDLDTGDITVVKRALDKYWSKYLPLETKGSL